ncbi:MAG TPA: hypothetical protein DCP96_01380 [Lachnospiraceae bacterium]|jgi:hypothetical protein|nr:hypothetical protein [Lachnospiraceae bacterium]
MNKDIKMDKILRYVCIGLGVLLIVAIFIPYIQLTGTAAKYSVDITLSNGKVLDGEAMKHLSIFDYIQVFIAGKDDLEQIGESYGTAYWAVYLVLYIASAAVFALTGLLSILGKRVGSIVFSIISILLNRVIYWDFEDRGIVGDYSRRVFGFAPYLIYIIAISITIISIVRIVMLKRTPELAPKKSYLSNQMPYGMQQQYANNQMPYGTQQYPNKPVQNEIQQSLGMTDSTVGVIESQVTGNSQKSETLQPHDETQKEETESNMNE